MYSIFKREKKKEVDCGPMSLDIGLFNEGSPVDPRRGDSFPARRLESVLDFV